MCAYVSGSPGTPASAIVEIERDGTARVVEGSQDCGTNSRTTLAKVVAETLGFKFEDVRTNQEIDTDSGTYGPLTSSSLTACHMTSTCTIAAREAKQKLLTVAASVMGVSAEFLDIKDSVVYDKRKPFEKATKMTTKTIMANTLITPIGTADWHHKDFPPMHYQTNATFADVEVDTDTGVVTILDIVYCGDHGQPLDPSVLENQANGAIQMQIGHTMMENSVYDPVTGKLLTTNWLDQRNPTTLDMPHKPGRIWFSDLLDDDSYYGVKGSGEGPTQTPSPAIGNAIYNAIGVRVFDECYDPNHVLKALGKLEA
jgi:CO/xanthine dehydrogenase Mo-binding subunit